MLIRWRRLIKILALTTLISRNIKFVYSADSSNKNPAANPGVPQTGSVTPDPGGGGRQGQTTSSSDGTGEQPKSATGSQIIPTDLNISNKGDTQRKTCTTSETVHTYEAKQGFAFKDVYEKPDSGTCDWSSWFKALCCCFISSCCVTGSGCCNSNCCQSDCFSSSDEEKDIWKAENNNYSSKVEYDEKNSTVTIHLGDGSTKKFKKGTDKKWTEDSGQTGGASSRTAIELDINSKKTTEQLIYNKNDKILTYTAKEGYGFNKVLEKKTLGKDKDIWSTSDPKQYATKVVFDDKNNTVTVHLPGDTKKVYKKSGGLTDKKWTELNSSEHDGSTPSTDGANGQKSSTSSTDVGKNTSSTSPSEISQDHIA